MISRKSVLYSVIVFIVIWLPWLLIRLFSRPREIVIRCDGGEGQAVTVETEER